jgi:hypothetical protein
MSEQKGTLIDLQVERLKRQPVLPAPEIFFRLNLCVGGVVHLQADLTPTELQGFARTIAAALAEDVGEDTEDDGPPDAA